MISTRSFLQKFFFSDFRVLLKITPHFHLIPGCLLHSSAYINSLLISQNSNSHIYLLWSSFAYPLFHFSNHIHQFISWHFLYSFLFLMHFYCDTIPGARDHKTFNFPLLSSLYIKREYNTFAGIIMFFGLNHGYSKIDVNTQSCAIK